LKPARQGYTLSAMAATAIDFSTERGTKARDHILYLVRNPDARIQNDGTGSVIPIPSAGGVYLMELSIYETGARSTRSTTREDPRRVPRLGLGAEGPRGRRGQGHRGRGRRGRGKGRRLGRPLFGAGGGPEKVRPKAQGPPGGRTQAPGLRRPPRQR